MDQQGFYAHPPSADQFGRNNKMDSMDILPTETKVVCRICLDDEGQLIQLPCSCIGQIGVLHEECFKKWIQSLQNDPYNFRNRVNQICENPSTYSIDCEICKGNIKLIMQEKTHCIKLEQLKKGYSVASILCILFNIGLIVLTTVLCVKGIMDAAKNEKGFSIFISVLIMLIVYIVLGWVIKKEVERFFVKQVDSLVIEGAFVIGSKQGPDLKNFAIKQNEEDRRNAETNEQGRSSERSRSSRRRRKRNEKSKKQPSHQQQINLQI